MELLEYVRRNAILPGPCVDEAPSPTFEIAEVLRYRGDRPCDEVDDTVSIELVPFSDTVVGTPFAGIDGLAFAGARKPFLVVVPDDCLLKRPLALGADATRRMNRVADAPIARGDRGPPDFAAVTGPGRGNDVFDALDGGSRWLLDVCRAFSDFVRDRDWGCGARDASVDGCAEVTGVLGAACEPGLFESEDCELEEL